MAKSTEAAGKFAIIVPDRGWGLRDLVFRSETISRITEKLIFVKGRYSSEERFEKRVTAYRLFDEEADRDAAFLLLSNACGIFAEKEARDAYDQARKERRFLVEQEIEREGWTRG